MDTTVSRAQEAPARQCPDPQAIWQGLDTGNFPGKDHLSSQTLLNRCRKVRRLLQNFARELHPELFQDRPGKGKDVDALTVLHLPEDLDLLPDWYISFARKRGIRKKTFFNERTSLVWALQGVMNACAMDRLQTLDAKEVVGANPGSAPERLREPSESEVRNIFARLERMGTPGAAMVLLWLKATLASGLRPFEWFDARLYLDEEGGILSVRNSKYVASTLAGNGPFRHLFFARGACDAQLACLDAFLRALQARYRTRGADAPSRKDFEYIYRSCTRTLCRVQTRNCLRVSQGRKVFLTLYSMRHMFAAEMKFKAGKMGFDASFVAALMGHAVHDTAWRHYADRALASSRRTLSFPLPLTEEQVRVRLGRTLLPGLQERPRESTTSQTRTTGSPGATAEGLQEARRADELS